MLWLPTPTTVRVVSPSSRTPSRLPFSFLVSVPSLAYYNSVPFFLFNPFSSLAATILNTNVFANGADPACADAYKQYLCDQTFPECGETGTHLSYAISLHLPCSLVLFPLVILFIFLFLFLFCFDPLNFFLPSVFSTLPLCFTLAACNDVCSKAMTACQVTESHKALYDCTTAPDCVNAGASLIASVALLVAAVFALLA